MGSFKWLTESNRWKHLVLAICIGLWANSWYCAEYVGVGVAIMYLKMENRQLTL